MYKRVAALIVLVFASTAAFPQGRPQKKPEDQPIRISTELVQLDAVVVDKAGKVVRGLTKEDFELYESGKRQHIGFFEFVDAIKAEPVKEDSAAPAVGLPEDVAERDIGRIVAFVIDDLTIRADDLVFIREMLEKFIEERMRPTDLVGIFRTVGGKGMLNRFTTNRDILRRAIATLTPSQHALNTFSPKDARMASPGRTAGAGANATGPTADASDSPADNEFLRSGGLDAFSPIDDSNKVSRASMSLGTASFVIESMKQLRGRKSLVLISGGLPILNSQGSTAGSSVLQFMRALTDKATRAGVAIHTMDVQGLSAQVGVARYVDTPGRSMIPTSPEDLRAPADDLDPNNRGRFGRTADEKMLGNASVMTDQLGLRALASATGGIFVLNRNDFNEGLAKILDACAGYYLLAYTPTDSQFKGEFRKIEIKVKRGGLKVLSRGGYTAREETAADSTGERDRMLEAIKSPLARRDLEIDAMLLYKAAPPDLGVVDFSIVVDPRKLKFDEVDGKDEASYEIAGFVFDEFGKLRGGFSDTLTPRLTPEQHKQALLGGLPYFKSVNLPAGTYQIRLAARDTKTGLLGTISRYVEVRNLSRGRLDASSVALYSVSSSDTSGAATPVPITANRRIVRSEDLRYALAVYNLKTRDRKPEATVHLSVTAGGEVIYQEPDTPLETRSGETPFVKIGQFGLAKVKPGRYTLTLVVTDHLAEKKAQTVTRSQDFIVVE